MGRLLRTDIQSQVSVPSRSQILRHVELKDLAHEPRPAKPPVLAAAGIKAQYSAMDTVAAYSYQWVGRAHYLAIHDLHLADGETFSDASTVDRRRDRRGLLTFIPAGCRIWGWSIPRAAKQSFTALYLEPHRMEEELAQKVRLGISRPLIYFSNAALRSSLERIQCALSGKGPFDALYLESLCLVTMLELCVIQKETLAAIARPTGQLCKAHVERIREYVDANLSREISLSDLARVVGLSRFHFLRAFKQTTQETPHRYLLRRRIEHAHEFLQKSDQPVSQIAPAFGFKDATRFIRAYRRVKGITPGKWRRQQT